MLVLTKIRINIDVIAVLHPQSACQFSRQPSGGVSQALRSSSPSHMICCCYVSRIILSFSPLFGCRNTLVYAKVRSRILPTCDFSSGSLTLCVIEAGDFVELIVLYLCARSRGVINQKHSLRIFTVLTAFDLCMFCCDILTFF